MKKLLFTLSLVCTAFIGMNSASAQAVQSGAEIKFEQETIDYGTIDQYADGVREFVFTNTGNEPLVISSARGSCGCTVPTYPREPIAPGESGKLKVKYDTKRVGKFTKSVTIQSNAVTEPTKVLRIKGDVIAKPQGEAPVNNSGAPAN